MNLLCIRFSFKEHCKMGGELVTGTGLPGERSPIVQAPYRKDDAPLARDNGPQSDFRTARKLQRK